MDIEDIPEYRLPEYGKILSLTFYQWLLQQTLSGQTKWTKDGCGYCNTFEVKFPGMQCNEVTTHLFSDRNVTHRLYPKDCFDSLNRYGFTSTVHPDKNKYKTVLDELYSYLEQTVF